LVGNAKNTEINNTKKKKISKCKRYLGNVLIKENNLNLRRIHLGVAGIEWCLNESGYSWQ
jgi:hypothetical protein